MRSSCQRIIVALALVAALSPLGAQEKRVALVIGNGAYASVPKLDNPPNDAQDMAAKLTGLGFSVTKLVDAKLADMRKAQHDFADAAKGAGMRLFYYAGHGVQSEGQNWLLPVDASLREDYELSTQALSAQLVLDGLKAAGSGVNIVILDACRDNPFKAVSRSAGASRGLAVMGISGSLIVYATAPGSTAADGGGRNGLFTEALLSHLDSPGVSLQEIMTKVAADVVGKTKGAQEPWKQDNLTKMVYLVTPEEAQSRFAAQLAKGQRELEALNAQLAGLKGQLAAEQDAAKRASLELEIKKQAALQAQKKQEAEVLATERERQAQAEKSQAAMAAQLASYKAEATSREDAIRKAAEAKRKELESLKSGGSGALPYVLAIETARNARSDLGAQYDASLATVSASVAETYDKKLAVVATWTEEWYENTKEFQARVAAERSRLSSEKKAALADAAAQSEQKKQSALSPFAEAEELAIAGLEGARNTYKGSAIQVSVGPFDKDDKFWPITMSATGSDLAYATTFRYSVKNDSMEEFKRRAFEFDAWLKAGALFGEIESSVSYAGPAGFINQVEVIQLKAVDASGEKLIYEDRPAKPISVFTGSADRDKAKALSSYLAVSAPGAQITINGKNLGTGRALLPSPAAGSYTIKASLPDGTVLEEKRNLKAGATEWMVFDTSGSLEVSAKTEGELWMDGISKGRVAAGSPSTFDSVPLGARNLELRYPEGTAEKLAIHVSAKERVQVAFKYEDLFVRVPAGSFTMGSPASEKDRDSDEGPQHTVRLSAFSIGQYEVTQGEWQAVMGSNPSYFKGDRLPVEQVCWYDILVYCNKKSLMEGLSPCYRISGSTDPARWGSVPTSGDATWNAVGCDFSANGYRLPTEAEWEYAAKGGSAAGSLASNAVYAGSAELDSVAWYSGNSGRKTKPVGQKRENALGLYDMAGNVWEWCWDWYADDYYGSSPSADPTGASSGGSRAYRGGSWYYVASCARSASRNGYYPAIRGSDLGFRVLRRP